MNLPEILGIRITFGLPDWITDERYEYDKVYYFSQFNAWAGSYDRTEYGNNIIEDELFKIKEIKEICTWPGSSWLIAEFDCGLTPALHAEVAEVQMEIAKVLQKMKSKRAKTVYINKPAKFK